MQGEVAQISDECNASSCLETARKCMEKILAKFQCEHIKAPPTRVKIKIYLLMQIVISEVSSSSPQALQAVKLLAQYFGSKEDKVQNQGSHLHPS